MRACRGSELRDFSYKLTQGLFEDSAGYHTKREFRSGALPAEDTGVKALPLAIWQLALRMCAWGAYVAKSNPPSVLTEKAVKADR